MECGICSKDFSGKRKPLCVSCAQTTLYGPRLRQAAALLDREKSHTYAEAVVRPGNDGILAALPDDADFDTITTSIKTHHYDRSRAERAAIDSRINDITEKADQLRKQMDGYRTYMNTKKQEMERRRNDLVTEQKSMEKVNAREIEPVQLATKKLSHKLDKTHNRICDSRNLLFHEAVLASKLRKRKGSNGRVEYIISEVIVPDLRDLNSRSQAQPCNNNSRTRTLSDPHELLSGSLDHLARLVHLCAFYLSIRLPAEVLLPNNDFPRAAIMPEKSSYKFQNIPFPKLSQSQPTSPAASRTLDQNLPRPRPLYIDRPLVQLSKEDPKLYGLFVEGVTLLAWDLAWLCKTQGINTINTFEDVCDIGRNLWQLLVLHNSKTQPKPPLERKVSTTSGKDVRAAPDSGDGLRLGFFTHGSVQDNLASAEGLAYFKDWKLTSPARLIDKLKSYLLTEMSGAEWDLLEEQEWIEEREDEKPVLVGGSGRPQQDPQHPVMSVMTVGPHGGIEDEKAMLSDSKQKKNSGWMKVRGRAVDG